MILGTLSNRAKTFFVFQFCVFFQFNALAEQPISASTLAGHPALGRWRLEIPQLRCFEELELRPDGRSNSRSAGQRLESQITIDREPSDKGFYKWTETIVLANTEPDCSGDRMEAGRTFVLYVKIPLDGHSLKICTAEADDKCVAEYQRERLLQRPANP
jgi:hypothetical protein